MNPALFDGRKRGVIFDVGHGGGSFAWRVAVPAIKEGFLPDSISTDLHIGSMNAGMKDMLNVMSKFLALGMSARRRDRASTWNPGTGDQAGGARAPLGRRAGGHRRAARGERQFGFVDSSARACTERRSSCEMTLRDGKVVYDLNGLTRPGVGRRCPPTTWTGDPRWNSRP